MKIIHHLIGTLFISGLVLAQEPAAYQFTVEEAVSFALDSNYTAINSRRDIAKAIKQKWETTAQGLPQINGVLDYQYQIRQPQQLIPAEFFGGEPGTFAPVVFGTKQTANLTATLTQLIFDGSYLVGLKAARTFLDFSKNANEKTQLEVRKGVINAYGSVLLARESISILKRNISNLQENVDETAIIVANGLAEEEDLEQLQITLASLQNQLNNTVRMENIAKQMFNLALGIPINAPVILTEDLASLAQPAMQLIQRDLNIENNVDYKIAFNLTEQRDLEVQLEKSKALPRLTSFINLGTFAGRNEFNFFDSDRPWFASSVVGASLTVPIFSSGMRAARTARAAIALDQAQTDLERVIQEIELALSQAKSEHELAIDNYQTSLKNLALAERIATKNEIKFEEGVGGSFDLRQAQTQLYTVQQELIQAMLTIINTKATLETILNIPDYSTTRNK